MSRTMIELGIDKMDRQQRLALVQDIWDSLVDDDAGPDLTANQKRDLQRRVTDRDADPTNVLTWEQIKAHVKRNR